MRRLPLVALGVLALLAGLWAGLIRIGWPLPALRPGLVAAHGPLMVSGFLGTLISLERAVALGRPAAYAVPLATGLGGLALTLGLPWPAAPLLVTFGAAGLTAIFVSALAGHRAFHLAVMGIGAGAWLLGSALWLGGAPVYGVVACFGAFLVFTIVGERLELSRLAKPVPFRRETFLGAAALYVAGLLLTLRAPDVGARLEGAGMLCFGLWLLRFDIARYTVRQPGLPRFIAASLLSGYGWLGVAGILWILYGGAIAGPFYDAMLHALFLGFVFAMIFAHAPVILPAVVGGAVHYRPAFYVPLALLNLSLVMRLCGDLGRNGDLRRWGGLLGAVAVLAFLATTAGTARKARSR